MPSALKAWGLNHRTAKEVPRWDILMCRNWKTFGSWHNSKTIKNDWDTPIENPGNQISAKDTEHQGQGFWRYGRKNMLQMGFYKFTIGCRWWLQFGLYFQGLFNDSFSDIWECAFPLTIDYFSHPWYFSFLNVTSSL